MTATFALMTSSNSEAFPDMVPEATDFNIDENGNGTLTGDLTIRETTKSVTLDVETEGIAEDPFGNTRVGFEASTKNRPHRVRPELQRSTEHRRRSGFREGHHRDRGFCIKNA